MGREARVRKPRPIRSADGEIVYTTASEARDESEVIQRAKRAGLILARVVLPEEHR